MALEINQMPRSTFVRGQDGTVSALAPDEKPPVGSELLFEYAQVAEVVTERDRYRAALYEATEKRAADAEKALVALDHLDQLHRELHTVCKERDTARHELGHADDILDSPLRTVRFATSVVVQVAREKARGRARRFVTAHTPRVTPREPRRRRMAR